MPFALLMERRDVRRCRCPLLTPLINQRGRPPPRLWRGKTPAGPGCCAG